MEEKRNSDNLAKELESNISFFQIEIQEKNKILIENLPKSVDSLQNLFEVKFSKKQCISLFFIFLELASKNTRINTKYSVFKT